MSKISIVEMSLRDGLQNEAVYLDKNQRLELINKLIECGVKRIEAGAFVSPKWVPQMQITSEIFSELSRLKKDRVSFSALVPNEKGFVDALNSGVREIAIFGAVSETFSKKNINCTVKESLKNFSNVVNLAKKNKIKVRGYLSTVFGCPYEGRVDVKKVIGTINKYLELGVYEVSLGDTIGVATPSQVRKLLKSISNSVRSKKIAMHFHDTRGTALANILASLDLGIKTFDSSLGGAGGCPYAPGAAGNVATEDVVYMLDGMGIHTGLNLEKLINTTKWFNRQLGRQLPSKLSLAGVGPIVKK